MVGFFRAKYKGKPDVELYSIAASTAYQKEAVYAALLELEQRNVNIDEYRGLYRQLQNELTQEEATREKGRGLIPKWPVYLPGFLLNPIFASVPYIANLITAKRAKYIWEAVLFLAVFTTLNLFVMPLLNWHFGAALISNALGTTMLTELFWKRHLSGVVLSG